MTVDNRTQDDPNCGSSAGMAGMVGTSSLSSANFGTAGQAASLQQRDDIVASPLERLIHTKWAEAKVTFKGPPPASLSN